MLGTMIIGGMALCGALGTIKMIFESRSEQIDRWEGSHRQLKAQMDQCLGDMNRRMAETWGALRFHELNEQYFLSRKLADHTHTLLSDAYELKRSYIKSIDVFKSEIRNMKDAKAKASDFQERKRIKMELDALYSNKDELYAQMGNLDGEISAYRSKLKEFNDRTHDLKLSIRDSCGEGGRIWYERLETRKRDSNYKQIRG